MKKILQNLGSAIRKLKKLIVGDQDKFLKSVSGVIHIGANEGQERLLYEQHKLNVIWIEPIPSVFKKLEENIVNSPNQEAIQALITDKDDIEYNFHVSNNAGLSSSILELKDHRDMWPEVNYNKTIKIQSKTLSTLVKEKSINMSKFDALVLDTQGAELLVLQGSDELLSQFKFIKVEVSDFESYADGCQLHQLEGFLKPRGFSEHSRKVFAKNDDIGSYYDIVYKNSLEF